MKTVGDIFREDADKADIPPRTLDQIKKALVIAKKSKSDLRLASLILQYGRMTDEARGYVKAYLE